MSLEATLMVWEHSEQTGSMLNLMLAVADSANDEREASVFVEFLARRSRLGERAVQKALRKLEACGELVCIERGGRRGGQKIPSTYRVCAPNVADDSWVNSGSANGSSPLPVKDEGEQVTQDGANSDSPNGGPPIDKPAIVWAHYVEVMEPRRKELDQEGRRLILDALKVASVEECCAAIDGCRASKFHMGDNDRHKKYNALSQILKGKQGRRTTREQVDMFLEIAEKSGVGAGITSADAARVRQEKLHVRTGLAPGATEHLRKRGNEAADWLTQHGVDVVVDGRGELQFVARTGGTT